MKVLESMPDNRAGRNGSPKEIAALLTDGVPRQFMYGEDFHSKRLSFAAHVRMLLGARGYRMKQRFVGENDVALQAFPMDQK